MSLHIADPRPIRTALRPLGLRQHCPDSFVLLEFKGRRGERVAVWRAEDGLHAVVKARGNPTEVGAPDPPGLAAALGGVLHG